MVHFLKTDPDVFQAAMDGIKPWEMRLDDRGYQAGDVLCLKETRSTGEQMNAGAPLEYTGRDLTLKVVYVMRGPVYGLREGWCIMTTKRTCKEV